MEMIGLVEWVIEVEEDGGGIDRKVMIVGIGWL